MVRYTFNLPLEQLQALENLSGSGIVAEHIRLAITNYLKKKAKKVSVSPSKKHATN